MLLSFRVVNDPAVQGNGVLPVPGMWVDDVKVNATVVSDGSSLAPFKSLSETRPTAVSNFTVTLVSIDNAKKKITLKRFPLTGYFALSGKANVQKYIDKKADFVGAIVTYNDPGESATHTPRTSSRSTGSFSPAARSRSGVPVSTEAAIGGLRHCWGDWSAGGRGGCSRVPRGREEGFVESVESSGLQFVGGGEREGLESHEDLGFYRGRGGGQARQYATAPRPVSAACFCSSAR